jgi:DNA-binding transcriptional LysR family regulator
MLPNSLAGVNLNLLVALDALLDAQGVTSAARRVGVTQSAMSQSLAQLRGLLEDELLVRVGHQMTLTPRAEALAPKLRRALADLELALLAQPDFDPFAMTGRFVIGSEPSLSFLLAVSFHRLLEERAPGIDVSFDSATPAVTGLRSGVLDVATTMGAPSVQDISAVPLPAAQFVAVLRRGHPAAPRRGRRLNPKKWAAIPHIVMSTQAHGPHPLAGYADSIGVTPRVVMRLPSSVSCARAAAETNLCWNTVGIEVNQMRNYFPLDVYDLPSAPVIDNAHLCWHARRDNDPSHRFLREGVLESFIGLF